MRLASEAHTLLAVALLVPFIALSLGMLAIIFRIAWRGKIGGRS